MILNDRLCDDVIEHISNFKDLKNTTRSRRVYPKLYEEFQNANVFYHGIPFSIYDATIRFHNKEGSMAIMFPYWRRSYQDTSVIAQISYVYKTKEMRSVEGRCMKLSYKYNNMNKYRCPNHVSWYQSVFKSKIMNRKYYILTRKTILD